MKYKLTAIKPGASMEETGGNSARGFFSFKSRFLYAGAVVLTIILGLCSRKFSAQLPAFVSAHFGDALWAAMVYFGIRALLVKRSLPFAALAALLFCFVIEFSQLYQAGWINEIRQTLAGSLILGKGFLPIDLIRYSVGVGIAFLLDFFLLRKVFSSTRPAGKV